MTTKRTVTFALSSAVLSLMAIVPAGAQFNPQPEPPGVTAFGVAETHTAAIHVAYGRSPGDDRYARVAGIEPQPFRFFAAFFNSEGEVLARSASSVGYGKVQTIQVTGRELGVLRGQRGTFYVAVECAGDAVERTACAESISATLELYGSDDGATFAIVPCVMPAIVPVISGRR
jgi:hypothetical protein